MKQDKEEYVAQWYWQKDWKDEWCKAYYVGPREDWMNLLKEKKNGRLPQSVS